MSTIKMIIFFTVLSAFFLYTAHMTQTPSPTTQKNTDTHSPKTVCIIGGGICGLATAYDLQTRGVQTVVYESHTIGGGATAKSGGMLAGGIENEPSEQNLWKLSAYAQSLWDKYACDIAQDSHMSIGYQTDGTMMVATTKDDLNTIQFLYEYQTKIGVGVEWLSGRDITKMEPHLKTVGGMWCKTDYQVHSIDLTTALARAISKHGGIIHDHTPIKSITIKNNRATGIVLMDDTAHIYDAVVVCAGVHTPDILRGIMAVPIRPLKGQMIALKMPYRLIQRVVWAPKTYLIPKLDNTLLIGATVEEQGFNSDITAGGVYALLESAWRVCPTIEDLAIDKIWVGHRPTARDDAPIFGKTTMDNLYIASGHHRNGILLAPATGKIMADLICDNIINPMIQDFTPTRFNA